MASAPIRCAAAAADSQATISGPLASPSGTREAPGASRTPAVTNDSPGTSCAADRDGSTPTVGAPGGERCSAVLSTARIEAAGSAAGAGRVRSELVELDRNRLGRLDSRVGEMSYNARPTRVRRSADAWWLLKWRGGGDGSGGGTVSRWGFAAVWSPGGRASVVARTPAGHRPAGSTSPTLGDMMARNPGAAPQGGAWLHAAPACSEVCPSRRLAGLAVLDALTEWRVAPAEPALLS